MTHINNKRNLSFAIMEIENSPIFLGGLQRSGTSFTRAIIGSHPDICIFEYDLPLWTKFYPIFHDRDFSIQKNVELVVDEILQHKKSQNSQNKVERSKLLNELKNVSQIGDIFHAFLKQYAQIAGRKRFGIKTPHNEFFASEIFDYYPHAKFIHIIRDPRDVGYSLQNIIGKWKQKFNLYEHIERWQKSYELSKLNFEKFKPNYLTIKFEDTVLQPEKKAKEICSFLNIEYNSSILNMDKHFKWNGPNSSFSETKKQGKIVSQSPIGRFKEGMDENAIATYQLLLSKELHELGYPMVDCIELNKSRIQNEFKKEIRKIESNEARILALQRSKLYFPLRTVFRKIKGI